MTMTYLPTDFGVSIVHVEGRSKVRVTGDIDLATATELRQRLTLVITAGTGDVDLDLSDVTFLDCSGLGVLLAARQELRDRKHRLMVQHPSKPVLRLFELSRVLDLMMDARETAGDSSRAAQERRGTSARIFRGRRHRAPTIARPRDHPNAQPTHAPHAGRCPNNPRIIPLRRARQRRAEKVRAVQAATLHELVARMLGTAPRVVPNPHLGTGG